MVILFLLAGIIPAIILVDLGRSRYPVQGDLERFPGWAGFLSVALGGLLGTTLLVMALLGETGSPFVIMLLPSMCALFAEICLCWVTVLGALVSGRTLPSWRWPAGLLLAVPFLLVAFALLGDRFIVQVVLFGGALLAVGWLVWDRLGKWTAFSYLGLLLLMVLAVWVTDTATNVTFLPTAFAPVARTISWLAPGLGIVFCFRLLCWGLAGDPDIRARRMFRAGLLAAPLFLLMAWQATTASAWDVATDGLGGIFLLELASVIGIAAAIHQSWEAPARRNAFHFGVVGLFLIVVMAANAFGTFGFDGAWGNVPHARTARRAATINRAVLRYYQEQGQYPRVLADLRPAYLLYLPTPFIIPGQDWCYQGGPDFYRLGYVDRDYFSTPASVTLFASAGQPPDPSWACEAEAAKYPGLQSSLSGQPMD